MPETNGKPDDFPRTETFRDCCGRLHDFDLALTVTDGGFFLRATEQGKGDGGYHIAAHSESSQYAALGRLRAKIRKYLATRYLMTENGRRTLSHDVARAYIGSGGVIIDGEFVDFEEFTGMLQTYEGWELVSDTLGLRTRVTGLWRSAQSASAVERVRATFGRPGDLRHAWPRALADLDGRWQKT